jgi:hypothetical protein
VDIDKGKEAFISLAGQQLAMLSVIQQYDHMIYPIRHG